MAPLDDEAAAREAGPAAHPKDRLPRSLSLFDASMLIVASVVGSGIFFTPAQVAGLLPGAGWMLAAWLVGGLLSLVGALLNAELGAQFPRAGGDYVYLREGIHPAAGFLVGWLSFFAIYAGTIAALAVVLAEAAAPAFGLGRRGIVFLAAGAIGITSLANLRSTRLSAVWNNLTSTAKVVALLAFVLLGPIVGEGSLAPWLAAQSAPPAPDRALAVRFGLALSPVLFSYLGWNASVYVASEIVEPARNLPRSLFLGLGLCIVLYLGVNVVYFYALPPAALRAANDVGAAAAAALFGPIGAAFVAGFVLLSVVGTLNATVLVGPRIAYAMALDGLFADRATQVHPRYHTPGGAIALQAAVSIVLVFSLETFPRALDFTVFAIVLATSADTLAFLALRSRRPEAPRPFRAWGHPWLPFGYLLVHLAIGAAIARARPLEAAATLGWLAVGGLLYWALSRREARPILPRDDFLE